MRTVSASSERAAAVTRRALIGAGLALTLAGCNSTAIEMPAIGRRADRLAGRGGTDGRARRSAPGRCGSA